MNENQFKKNVGYSVRLRPPAVLNDGTEVDYEWILQSADTDGITITTHTDHQQVLSYDQIREFMEDPAHYADGLKHAFLHLKVQLRFTALGLRVEP